MAVKEKSTRVPEFLERFAESATLEQVREILNSGEPITRCIHDFEDPGTEVKIGTRSRVTCQELGPMERLILPENNFLPVHFLEEGAVVQRAVARVNLSFGFGTGFLVSPSILMTNNHVLSSENVAAGAKAEFNYQMDFSGIPQSVDSYTFDPSNLFYTNASLDFTIVRIKPKCVYNLRTSRTINAYGPEYGQGGQGGQEFYGEYGEPTEEAMYDEYTPNPFGPYGPYPNPATPRLSRNTMRYPRPVIVQSYCHSAGSKWGSLSLPKSVSYAGPTAEGHGQHVNIVQHPKARRKEVAMQDNTITNIFDERIRYATDTDLGSSGSPVFNNAWDLIAIHHAAGDYVDGGWVSNEGMRMDSIVENLQNHFNSLPGGTAILTELGIL